MDSSRKRGIIPLCGVKNCQYLNNKLAGEKTKPCFGNRKMDISLNCGSYILDRCYTDSHHCPRCTAENDGSNIDNGTSEPLGNSDEVVDATSNIMVITILLACY